MVEPRTFSGAGTYTTIYVYDTADRVITTTYPGGEAVATKYDNARQPYGLTGWSNYVISATYNALGQPSLTYFGNGLMNRTMYYGLDVPASGQPLNYLYAQLRRICILPWNSASNCESDSTPAPDALLNVALNYDPNGNVSVFRDAGKKQKLVFGYDSLNRLISTGTDTATVTYWGDPAWGLLSESYTYDPTGNRLTHTRQVSGSAAMTDTLGYTSAQPHAATTWNGEQRYWYDANGNMTVRVEFSGTQRITYTQAWDIDDRLIAVTSTLGAIATTTFAYDANGQRVKRVTSQGTVWFVAS